MIQFEKFYIESFKFDRDKNTAFFYFSFDKKEFFTEEIIFQSKEFNFIVSDFKAINTYLFPLSLALGISYYKLSPTREIIVESGFLDEFQKDFWKKFYIMGLGEFFYTNKIDFSLLCNFVSSSNNVIPIDSISSNSEKYLLPIGGGKDSIVSSVLLEKNNIDFTPFIFGKIDIVKEKQLEVLGLKGLLVERKISSHLFNLQNTGSFYNGHVPITGIISFVSVLTSYLYGYSGIIFSNEKSANTGNTFVDGIEINHQYSKTFEFEKDFNEYKNKYISKNISYFSLLRPLYEIQIAKFFSENASKYFSIFSSCNNNFKIVAEKKHSGLWCNTCPKCVFVYTILRPFLSQSEVVKVFGKELYNEEELLPLFLEIWGFKDLKPFECVGETDESILATMIFLYKNPGFKTKILNTFKIELNKTHYTFDIFNKKYFKLYTEDNFIPPELFGKIKNNFYEI